MPDYKKAIIYVLTLLVVIYSPIQAALTIDPQAVTDWTAVAQNTVAESATITCSSNYMTILHLQAFLDSTTAHTGTGFRLQTSSADSGDEDWNDYGGEWQGLVGTANSEAMTNILLAGSTTITVSDTGGNYEAEPCGQWIAIEDSTLVNSELVFQTGFLADASITILDGATNQHASSTVLWDIALTRTLLVPLGTNRARLLINNTLDSNGSSLNYKLREVETTGL